MAEYGVSLNPENVSNRHHGGHQDWLKDRQLRQDTRLRDEASASLLAGPVCLPEGDDLSPEVQWLNHERIVSGLRKFPEPFRAGISIVKAASEFFRDHIILTADQYCERAVVVAQIILGRKPIAEHPTDRKNSKVPLGDVGQAVVWGQEDNAGDIPGKTAS